MAIGSAIHRACHRAAFAHFGGVPAQILYDRTKTVVRRHVGVLRGLDTELYHPEALASATHYGFALKLCLPYRAKTKGKVESDVRWLHGRLEQLKGGETQETKEA